MSKKIERGAMSNGIVDQVVLEGDRVIHNLLFGGINGRVEHQQSTTLNEFTHALAERFEGHEARSLGLAPSGMAVRDIYQQGTMFVFLIEVAPGPRTMQWICDDSPQDYGVRTAYRDITISLPWQYFFVSMDTDGLLGNLNSVYVRNAPLRSLDDALYNPPFYNCSVNAYGIRCWICMQGYERSKPAGKSFLAFTNDFVEWFWYSGFNRSSEHHEGKSFWGMHQQTIKDPRVKTIAAWEAATVQDEDFALSVEWIPSGYVPTTVYRELIKGACVWQPKSSSDIAQVVTQAIKRKEKNS